MSFLGAYAKCLKVLFFFLKANCRDNKQTRPTGNVVTSAEVKLGNNKVVKSRNCIA